LKRKYKHGIWGRNTAVFIDDLIKGLQERFSVRFYAPFKVSSQRTEKNKFIKYFELLLQSLIATSSSNSTSSVHNTNETAKMWSCEIKKKLAVK
jgi:hypothetical protein